MHQHKKLRRPKHKASIDGIVPGSGSLGMPLNRTYQPSHAKLDNMLGRPMGRVDGFQPARSGMGSLGYSAESAEAELLDDPIVLDDDFTSQKEDRHRGRAKVSKVGKIFKRSALAIAVIILIGGAYFGVKLYITQKNLFRGGGQSAALTECADIKRLSVEGDCRVNILILGIGGPGHSGADLSDTVLLASIDPINNKGALLSIPRDLWVKIPRNGSQKINAAYAYGKQRSKAKDEATKQREGIELVEQTLQPILGVPIHYHTIINFAAFKQGVDALGGVTFYVPEQLYDPSIAWENKYNPVIAKKGIQTFDGARALLYVKSRQSSTDFARSERQRQVLVALKDKTLSLGTFSNPIKISQLMDSLGNNVYTDFSRSEITRLYKIGGKISSSNITSLDLVTPPNDLLTTANLGGLSIVRPKSGLYEYKEIQNYVRNSLRDGYLAKENAAVAIYNATTNSGLANTKATELKSYGYRVTAVGNVPTPTNPNKTMLVDLSKGSKKYTRHYLEKRFGVVSQTKLPPGFNLTPPVGTNFVIILGKDVTAG